MRRSADFVFILLIAGLLSFCSMGYELLIARFLASLTADAILAQSLTVGCFLFAMGFGAFAYGKRKPRSPWTFLVGVELMISLIASIAIPAMSLASLYVTRPWRLIVGCQLVTFAIGFLSGAELPALIEVAKKYSSRAFGWVLAANYLGALLISILLPQVFVPALGLYMFSWTLALATALAAGLMFIRSLEFRPSLRWPGLVVVLMLPPFLSSQRDTFEQFYLKSYYYFAPSSLMPSEIKSTLEAHADLPRVQRFSSPYQEIDIVQDDLHLVGLDRYDGEFHLLLDQRNQFGSHTEAIYHDTMVHGSINLARQKPARALVIGGGDGLIVRDLLRYPEVAAVTLVELDPMMIHLANDPQALRSLNKGALLDKRVTVVTGDGFEWLRRDGEKFDAIFIDLPHPNSLDVSRLYSMEFYTFAKRRLSNEGFLVFDFPFSSLMKTGGERSKILASSITEAVAAAGFKSSAAFGFWESFMIASTKERTFEFDYEALEPYVADISAFNLALVQLSPRPAMPNSIFRPRVMKRTFEGG
ncbi:MAG: hypothetical protein AAB250_04930 [Bdellovibrionota bacterium]